MNSLSRPRMGSITVVVICGCCAVAQTVSGPLSLSARMHVRETKIGNPVMVFVTVTNKGPESFSFRDTDPMRDYSLDVRDSAGKPIDRTEYGKGLLRPPAFTLRNTLVKLAPGESVEERLRLDNVFVLNAPGTYSVIVSRKLSAVSDEGKRIGLEFVLLAPTLKFSIEPLEKQ